MSHARQRHRRIFNFLSATVTVGHSWMPTRRRKQISRGGRSLGSLGQAILPLFARPKAAIPRCRICAGISPGPQLLVRAKKCAQSDRSMHSSLICLRDRTYRQKLSQIEHKVLDRIHHRFRFAPYLTFKRQWRCKCDDSTQSSERISRPLDCPFDVALPGLFLLVAFALIRNSAALCGASFKRSFPPFSRFRWPVPHTRKGRWISPGHRRSWGRSRPLRCTRVQSFVLEV